MTAVPITPPRPRKPYALIAEADPRRAATYVELVQQLGLEPNHVRDGQAGKVALRTRGAPALVVCELALPRVDGFALLEDLRQRTPAEETPVVVISTFLELRSRAWDQREELGIAEVLATTTPVENIQRALRRALSNRPAVERRVEAGPPAIDLVALASLPVQAFTDGNPGAGEALAQRLAEAFHVPIAVAQVGSQVYLGQGAEAVVRLDGDAPAQVAQMLHSHKGAAELIADAVIDPKRMTQPLVRQGLCRAIAVAPVISASGQLLGRLALLHPGRMALREEHLDALSTAARRLAGAVELRGEDPSIEIVLPPDDAMVHRQLVTALQEVDSGILLFDGGRVRFANRTATSLLGFQPDALTDWSIEEFLVAVANLFDDPSTFRRRLHLPVEGPFALREQLEQQRPIRRVVRWVWRTVAQPEREAASVLLLSDVTADADLTVAREALSRTDALTGLANRGAAEETLLRELARTSREQMPVSVALIDLDRFRRLNDEHGIATGDEILKRVALALDATVRGGDFVARWGADEFLWVLPGVAAASATIAGERFRREIAELTFGDLGAVTASIGIAELDAGKPPEVALRRARERLEEARASGGNAVR
jgi:diguanylate cyclase (GGDEF)-like protein